MSNHVPGDIGRNDYSKVRGTKKAGSVLRHDISFTVNGHDFLRRRVRVKERKQGPGFLFIKGMLHLSIKWSVLYSVKN